MKPWLIWAAGVAAMAIGCSHGSAAVPGHTSAGEGSAAGAYFPLKVGEEWHYRARLLGEERAVTVKILREEDGYFVDNQGGRLRVDEVGVRDRQRYLLQTPIEAGHTWVNVISPSSAEHYRIEQVGEACEAPVGRFGDCVVVEGSTRLKDTDGTLVNRLTMAPGVGLVRSEVYLLRAGKRTLQSQLLLESYLGVGDGDRRK